MEEEYPSGDNAETPRSLSEKVTTDVAARALGVTPRTIRNYIEQGKLEAESRGKGVEKTWFVSVESLQALRDERNLSARKQTDIRESYLSGITAEELFREIADRLEIRAAEVGELRIRLEMMEQAEDILKEERRRLINDLERERERVDQERRRAEEAQQTVEQLAQERKQAREEARRLQEELEAERGKGFWRRLFGG